MYKYNSEDSQLINRNHVNHIIEHTLVSVLDKNEECRTCYEGIIMSYPLLYSHEGAIR